MGGGSMGGVWGGAGSMEVGLGWEHGGWGWDESMGGGAGEGAWGVGLGWEHGGWGWEHEGGGGGGGGGSMGWSIVGGVALVVGLRWGHAWLVGCIGWLLSVVCIMDYGDLVSILGQKTLSVTRKTNPGHGGTCRYTSCLRLCQCRHRGGRMFMVL